MAWSDVYAEEAKNWRSLRGPDSAEAAVYDRLRAHALAYENGPRVKFLICPTCHARYGELHLKGCTQPFSA